MAKQILQENASFIPPEKNRETLRWKIRKRRKKKMAPEQSDKNGRNAARVIPVDILNFPLCNFASCCCDT